MDFPTVISGICIGLAVANAGLFIWCWWLHHQIDALRTRQTLYYETLAARIAHRKKARAA